MTFQIILIKANTISNKLASKVPTEKKGRKSYESYKYVFKFRLNNFFFLISSVFVRIVVFVLLINSGELGLPNRHFVIEA